MDYNSLHLKTALMAYYRFKRQYVCADEVHVCNYHLADVLVDTDTEVIEIEVKTSKSDLKADLKKSKHKWYKEQPEKYAPNKFYVCVPTELVECAVKWVEECNPNYGVIEFSVEKFNTLFKKSRRWEDMLYFARKAKPLHKEYKSKKERIALRLCSANINFNISVIYKTGAWYEERQKTLGEVGTSTPKENNVGENNHG